VKQPSAASILLGCISFVGICFSVPFWDHTHPFIFGVPFNMAWMLSWLVLSPCLLAIAYRIERRR
jgi:hypothetical protein